MTERDHLSQLAGYYPSAWSVECGGPRRQKVSRSPGPNIQPGEKLVAQSYRLDDERWPVMFIQRAPGELYLQGGTRPGQIRTSYGWVEQLDPVSLRTMRRSPKLPSGGHNWCGAACVHENGDIYVVNGSYCHRLSPDLQIVAEHKLQTDNAHNGHLVLSDGNLVLKDIQNDPAKRSVFTVLSPELEVVDRYEFPWNSVGRFSSDRVPGEDHIYVTSPREIRRLIYRNGRLSLDEGWAFCYRIEGEDQSFAWDSSVGDDCVWFMDMGENQTVRTVLSSHPIGTHNVPGRRLAMRIMRSLIGFGFGALMRNANPYGARTHDAPQRVFRVSVSDASNHDVLVPFGLPGGNIMAPPLYDQDRHILVAFDTMNSKLGAWRYEGPGILRPLWSRDWRSSNQLTLYADTGELIVDDCRRLGTWDAVVVDIETGRERGRVDTGCFLSMGMWYTPGFGRDFYTSTGMGGIARISVE